MDDITKEFSVFIKGSIEKEKINHIRITAENYEMKKDYTIFYYNEGIAGLIRTELIVAILDKTQTTLCG